MKIFLNCDDAQQICDKKQYKEAGLWNLIKLNFHIVFCLICRKHTSRNIKLSKAVKKAKIRTLSSSDKNALRERLRKEMSS